MIKDLVYKEFRLNIVPWAYTFFAFALLLLIPSWVFFIAIAYIYMVIMFVAQFDKANNDLAFAMSLPVPKRSIVQARTMTVIIVELGFLALCTPIAILRYYLYPHGNEVGMNVNLAFFGLMLVMFVIFNTIYLPGAYKRAYRMLWPLLGGTAISVTIIGILTTLIAVIPSLSILNDRGLGNLGAQATVFVASVVVYAVVTYVAYRKAASNFAKVDL